MIKYLQFFKVAFVMVLLLSFFSSAVYGQGSTRSSMSGYVNDEAGNPLPGATVIAVHNPSGAKSGTTTRLDGHYNLPNLRVGGPYTISFTFLGFEDIVFTDIFISLGKNTLISTTMRESAVELGAVEIVAGGLLDSERNGAQTKVSRQEIESLPTINRQVEDFVRLTPQASIASDGINIANTNNRYNAIFIDGAVNNDVFGLSDSGTNGGQTGISPISPDAIEQFQIVIAPYDVSLGGFTGGGINAVTKSGSNNYEGSLYWLNKSQNLVGKTPTYFLDEDDDRSKVADFTSNTFGLTIGGPIVKNKSYFFVNAELQRDETPAPFDPNTYTGSSLDAINSLVNKLNGYGYDPGSFGDKADKLDGEKFLVRLDFNLDDKNTLTARHSYTKGTQTNINASTPSTLNFENNGVLFPSTTNSTAIELNTMINNQMSNNLIIGYTSVRDDRDPIGSEFPWVEINDGEGTILFGSEQFSTANQLDQDIFTLTDNFKLFKGKNTFTFGTHNEYYNMYNLFVRQNFGSYEFASLDDFLNDGNAIDFERSYSLVDSKTGDGSAAGAEFSAIQFGLYAQDEYEVNTRTKLTFGLRMDIPLFLDDPAEDSNFNSVAIPKIEAEGYDLKGARSGQAPGAQILISPRFGFNIATDDSRKMIIRGGAGIFTGRIPFVWPAGMYSNNGLTVGGTAQSDVPFISNWDQQPTAADFGGADVIPSGQIDLFSEDFKYPQIFRGSIGADRDLGNGFVATVEGIFTQNINSIYYENVNLKRSGNNLTGTGDDRIIWDRRDEIDPTYTRVLLGSNASDNDAKEGYGYTITAQVQKSFKDNWAASAAYTYGDSYLINQGTSSQNSSQWRGSHSVNGRNLLTEAPRSDFAIGSKINAFISAKTNVIKDIDATFSIFYNGQQGTPYSYIYNGNLTDEDSRERSLVYVPSSVSDINLVDVTNDNGVVTLSAAEQWANLNAFIEQDDHLSENRGGYAEKNESRTPWENSLDIQGKLDFYVTAAGKRHQFQATLDIFNVLNLISKDAGRDYTMIDNGNFGSYELLNFEGFQADGTTPNFTYTGPTISDDIYDLNDFTSRWRGQVGLRYIFR